MAGRMGGERVTVQNLTVYSVDAEKGLILVRGAVPGAAGGVVLLSLTRPPAEPGAATGLAWPKAGRAAGCRYRP